MKRKQLQIEHAKTISKKGQLVKLADKYSNLRDLLNNSPSKWDQQEIHGYAVWCYAVVDQIGNINDIFKQLFNKFNIKPSNLDKELEEYYGNIKNSE